MFNVAASAHVNFTIFAIFHGSLANSQQFLIKHKDGFHSELRCATMRVAAELAAASLLLSLLLWLKGKPMILNPRFRSLGICATALLAFSACGKSADDTADTVRNGSRNLLRSSDLVGRWVGPCAKNDILNSGSHAILKFGPNAIEKEVHWFGNASCDNANIRVTYSGEYSILPGDGLPADVYPVDYSFTKVEVTPLNEEGAKTLRTMIFCGQTGWSANETKDMTTASGGVACLLDDVPSKQFDLVKVSDKKLQTGKMGIMQAPVNPDARPKDVAPEVFQKD